MSEEFAKRLDELELEDVVAHGGEGTIRFHRVFDDSRFQGPWNFVDYAVVPPGASIGRHRHGSNEEVYLVLEGRGKMFRDGSEFDVEAGCVVYNEPGGTHGLVNDGTVDLRLFVVEVELDAKGGSTAR